HRRQTGLKPHAGRSLTIESERGNKQTPFVSKVLSVPFSVSQLMPAKSTPIELALMFRMAAARRGISLCRRLTRFGPASRNRCRHKVRETIVVEVSEGRRKPQSSGTWLRADCLQCGAGHRPGNRLTDLSW